MKINITTMRPNFLLHMLWPTTSLKNQQTHLKLLWILIYAFMNRNKNIFENNISNRDKIMVNLPKVYFIIT
jgi:hypothetical protein